MRADLHCHSRVSDGTDPPAEVVRRAAAAGLDAIALTDHDTTAGWAEAGQALPPGLMLVPGAELSCRQAGHSVHLLAYLFDPQHEELAAELAKLRDSRLHRARQMVARLVALHVPVSWEQVSELAAGGVVGRPHIARAMVEAGAVGTFEEAFGPAWLGPGGPAHVPRYALRPARAIQLVRDAGGVSVLAHARGDARGWAVPDEVIADLAAAGLTGLEVNHPQHNLRKRGRLLQLAQALALVPSGGSDDHGALTEHRIGAELAPEGSCETLIRSATGTAPVIGTAPVAGT